MTSPASITIGTEGSVSPVVTATFSKLRPEATAEFPAAGSPTGEIATAEIPSRSIMTAATISVIPTNRTPAGGLPIPPTEGGANVNDGQRNSLIPVIAGSVAGAAAVFVIASVIVLVVILMRRRKRLDKCRMNGNDLAVNSCSLENPVYSGRLNNYLCCVLVRCIYIFKLYRNCY